jgi:protein-disulfide isomerase
MSKKPQEPGLTQRRDEKLLHIMSFLLLAQVVLSSIIILRLNALDRSVNQSFPFIKTVMEQPLPETEIVRNVSTDDDPTLGPDDAPITIIEFGDFQCGACRQAGQVLKRVTGKYTDEVRLVYRDFPLSLDSPSNLAAQAAQCAHEQGKFWEMHDLIFAGQEAITRDGLYNFAAGLDLKIDQFQLCLENAKYSEEVENDIADGQRYGVIAVPTFFVNGQKYQGALSFSEWQSLINELLAGN